MLPCLTAQVKCGFVAKIAPTRYPEVLPRFEIVEGFISAQEVRDIRAQLRNIVQQNEDRKLQRLDGGQRPERGDSEYRGVAGTLVLTDVLDDKVATKLLYLC